jgi:hypothetical protein
VIFEIYVVNSAPAGNPWPTLQSLLQHNRAVHGGSRDRFVARPPKKQGCNKNFKIILNFFLAFVRKFVLGIDKDAYCCIAVAELRERPWF